MTTRNPEGYNNRWRVCSYCSGWFLAYHSKSYGGRYFCPKHFEKFIEKVSNPQKGAVVSYIDDDTRRYIVLEREDDTLTVRRLGFPEEDSFPISVHCVWERTNIY